MNPNGCLNVDASRLDDDGAAYRRWYGHFFRCRRRDNLSRQNNQQKQGLHGSGHLRGRQQGQCQQNIHNSQLRYLHEPREASITRHPRISPERRLDRAPTWRSHHLPPLLLLRLPLVSATAPPTPLAVTQTCAILTLSARPTDMPTTV